MGFCSKIGARFGIESMRGGGMLHIAKILNEILGRDYGIEKTYRGPFITFTFISENISEYTVQRNSMTKKKKKTENRYVPHLTLSPTFKTFRHFVRDVTNEIAFL